MEIITRLEEMLLLSIVRLNNDAYAVPIIKDIKEKTGKSISSGALWVTLDNMSKRGLLRKKLADATSEVGGRGKLYYSLTPVGKEALKSALELHKNIWSDISEFYTEGA